MAETSTLTPPDQDILTPPEAVPVISPEKASTMVPVTEEQKTQLNMKVEEFINTVVSVDVGSDAFKAKVTSIHNMGNAEIRQAASMSNRMLERPMESLNNGIFDDKSKVGSALIDLRKTAEDLDPSRQGDLLSPRKLFGFIPWGNKLRNYFLEYQSAQTHINKIIESLNNGQDELRKDNSAIETEKMHLWEAMGLLEQYVYVGKEIDNALEKKVAVIETKNPEKARVVREEMLFYVRQKVQDLLTQLAVSVQGYMSLDLIRKNNLELIKGVDRATTTTVSALRTAVIVAQALTNQKLVLDQISALNKTTSDLIAGTAKMMKQQAAEIGQQASSATLELDKLKSAFDDIYDTMDMMSNYKVKALDSMKQTVDTLSQEIEKSKPFLEKIREEDLNISVATSGSNEVNI